MKNYFCYLLLFAHSFAWAQSPVSDDFLMGKFEPSQQPNFVRIARKWLANEKIGEQLFFQKEAYAAFERMADAAEKDGVKLRILSATRNFAQQKSIWEKKWAKLAKKIPNAAQRASKILEYSAMPGASRHHWGTDLDLNSLDNNSFLDGDGAKTHRWLVAHAADFGFFQPYTERSARRPYGYNEEKWHWSYAPISDFLTQSCRQQLHNQMLDGFSGAATAAELQIIEKYVLVEH